MLFSPYGNIRRIKIYRDKDGQPKGDALITYAKPGSVVSAASKVSGRQTDRKGEGRRWTYGNNMETLGRSEGTVNHIGADSASFWAVSVWQLNGFMVATGFRIR